MNQTKTIFVIATLVAAVGTIGLIAGAPAADAAPTQRAPGQFGCNPGHNEDSFCGRPPGQSETNNPGKCQNSLDEAFGEEIAHEFCHEKFTSLP